jgi:biopolymer transport protein ExbD
MSSQGIAMLRTPGLSGWIDGVAARIVQRASRHAPGALSARLEEEWSADLSERPGPMARLSFALGCYWAAAVISHDQGTVSAAVIRAPSAYAMTVPTPPRGSRLPWRPTTAGAVICDVNTTPLIDVMLVLLVTLIITLPVMTHAVKLDLPRTPLTREQTSPEVINLEIDSDGTVVWNGTVLAGLQQLDGYFRTEAQKNPQPEIHLRPDRRARYDVVARVLASAQHSRMERIGFVNTAEFDD